MGKKTLVGGVINEVLSVFGLGGHYETVSDIDIQTLLTKGKAYEEQRKASIIAAKGDLQVYAQSMQGASRAYRRKFSASTVERYGYAPSTNATINILDDGQVLNYLQTTVNSHASTINYLNEGASTIDRVAFYELQEAYGVDWSNTDSTLTVGSGHYRYTLAEKINSTDLEVTFREYHEESINNNLVSNYAYDDIGNTVMITSGGLSGTSAADTTSIRIEVGTEQTIQFNTTANTLWTTTTQVLADGIYTIEVWETDTLAVETMTTTYDITIDSTDVYDVGEITNNITDGKYTTIMTLQSDGVTTANVYTEPQDIIRVVPSALYDTETMQVEYELDNSADYAVYLESLVTVPASVRSTESLDLTPIITVKQENEILDQEDRNLQLMMRNIGVDPESIYPSLDQENLNSAYLIYGVPFDTTDPACIRLLYDMFNLPLVDQGNVQINISNLDMNYSYRYLKTTTVGSIGSTGTTTKVIVNEPILIPGTEGDTYENHYNMYLRKQVTSEEYVTLKISDLMLRYVISGETNEAIMNATGSEARFLIPLNLLHKLNTRDYYDVYEESLALLAYAEELIYLEWYETEFFSFLMTAIALVVAAITQQWWLIPLAIAVAYVIEWIIEEFNITGGWATALRVVGALLVAWAGGGFDSMWGAVGTSFAATATYFNSQATELQKAGNVELEGIYERTEDVSDQIKELADTRDDVSKFADIEKYSRDLRKGRQPVGIQDTPEVFYYQRSPEFVTDEIDRAFVLNWELETSVNTG